MAPPAKGTPEYEEYLRRQMLRRRCTRKEAQQVTRERVAAPFLRRARLQWRAERQLLQREADTLRGRANTHLRAATGLRQQLARKKVALEGRAHLETPSLHRVKAALRDVSPGRCRPARRATTQSGSACSGNGR